MKKLMTDVRAQQEPLLEQYRRRPEDARIIDHATTLSRELHDPIHGWWQAGSKNYGITWDYGIHEAVGGLHDAPNPGDMLAAALAACLDSTIRMTANRMGIQLEYLSVEVFGEVDVRGTLVVDRSVPVGFQKMRVNVRLKTSFENNPNLIQKLLRAAEYSCVNLQTLQKGVPVETILVTDQID